jgi:outer membrane protein
VAMTSRTVRRAYWDLAYAVASLRVNQQSLELAQESLRNTRARIEIGTTPPIDEVEAEAEVATRQEAVIVAQSDIETAQDALRVLVLNPSMPDFWTVRIDPSDRPAFDPVPVDVDGAVVRALEQRTDLEQQRKSLEESDINLRYYRNQTLPEVTANFDYGLSGLGGTQFIRTSGFPGEIVGENGRGFGSVLGDLFGNQFPSWTLSVNVSHPLGASAQEASLARARLQHGQSLAQIRDQELQVTSQVRNAARQLLTNQQRVQTTRVSRELAERRLDAEQKKLTAGTSTNFVVFQVQRDLTQAQNNELRAILDYNRSIVDFETVQQAPLGGGGTTTSGSTQAVAPVGGTTATTTATR